MITHEDISSLKPDFCNQDGDSHLSRQLNQISHLLVDIRDELIKQSEEFGDIIEEC